MKKEYTKKNADSKPASMIVLDIFAQKIINGEYRSGDRLKETLLAVEFGVSRNAVREALNQLVGYHVVEYLPYCGYRMKVFTNRDILEWFEFREAIEPIAARRLAIIRPAEAIEKLGEYIEKMQLARKNGDEETVNNLDMLFHLSLIEYCDNTVFNKVLSKVYFTSVFSNYDKLPLQKSELSVDENFFQTNRIHSEILRCIIEGNADDAETITRKHVHWQVRGMMHYIALVKNSDN